MIGGKFISILLMVSILGALGGLIMTNPRLIYGMSAQFQSSGKFSLFKFLSKVNSKTGAPSGSLLFMGAISIVALIYLQSFSRIVNFFVVPNHFFNILLVASIFKFRKKIDRKPQDYHTPFYPVTPILFIITILGFLFAAIIYRPQDTIIGILLTAIGIPFYLWFKERK
jgi:APA family basic amino acid/polyamine antiporter|tara:strand:- start:773 stop:1279 length:507 start_codon:yes stop_codon:yes gene_type:complete